MPPLITVDSNQTIAVRDLWAHEDIGLFNTTSFTAPDVPGNGGIAFFKFSLVSQ